eukprot:g5498.t1
MEQPASSASGPVVDADMKDAALGAAAGLAEPQGVKRDVNGNPVAKSATQGAGDVADGSGGLGSGSGSLMYAQVDDGADGLNFDEAFEIDVKDKCGKGHKIKRARVVAEKSTEDAEAMNKAILAACIGWVKPKKGQKEKSWSCPHSYFSTPFIDDANDINNKLTAVEFIARKFVNKNRKTFKCITLKDDQWEQAKGHVVAYQNKKVEEVQGDVRLDVAAALGAETEEKKINATATFLFAHGDALEAEIDSQARGLLAGPTSSLPKVSTSTAAAAPAAEGATSSSSSSLGLAQQAPAAAVGASSSSGAADNTLPRQLLVPGSSQGSSYSQVDPEILALCAAGQEVVQEEGFLVEDEPVVAATSHEDMVAALTLAEVGSYYNKSGGLLAVLAKIDPAVSQEAVSALIRVSCAGTYKHEIYGGPLLDGARAMLSARITHVAPTMKDLCDRFALLLEPIAPKTVTCALFINAHLTGGKLRVTDLEAVDMKKMILSAEIKELFDEYKKEIAERATKLERIQKIVKALSPAIGKDGKCTTERKDIDLANKELDSMLATARSSEAIGAPAFYSDLLQAAAMLGVMKMSMHFIHDTYVHKRANLVVMPKELQAVRVFASVMHAREDLKKTLDKIITDTPSMFTLLKQVAKIATPELGHEVADLESRVKALNEKQREILVSAVGEFVVPPSWIYGGLYDATAKEVATWMGMTFAQREKILTKATAGDDNCKLVQEYAVRTATSKKISPKSMPLLLANLTQVLNSQATKQTEKGMANAANTADMLKYGMVYMKEADEMVFRRNLDTLARLQAKEQAGAERAKQIKKGLLNIAKGKA